MLKLKKIEKMNTLNWHFLKFVVPYFKSDKRSGAIREVFTYI
jgi:hypothetical protein